MSPFWSLPIRVIKRRVYLAVLPLGTLICMSLWWLERRNGTLHAIDRVGLPLFAALCLALLFALSLQPKHLRRCELALYSGFVLLYLASLSYSLQVFALDPSSIWNLAGLTYWGPVLYTLGFFVFGMRRGLWVGIGVHSVFTIVVLDYLVTPHLDAATGTGEMLVQGFAAGSITLFLLWAGAGVLGAQVRASARLEDEADTDPLTRLANRRQLRRQLEYEVVRMERLGGSFCVAFLDLDHFKQVNDRYGHAVGDAVLTELGQKLKEETRSLDTVGRWGGEEFIVLLPGLSLDEAHGAVERLRLRVADHSFSEVGFLTVSVGVAMYRPSMTFDELLLRADRALYQAKELGRNRVVSEIAPDVYQERSNGELLN